jgi:hypothetical protein
MLAIRAQHITSYPDLADVLQQAISRVGGLILAEDYTRQQMNDLLACSDAHVSLHRAEGFGLGIAESMYLGKPVVATHYSGNADFMTPENSYPVGYTLRPITEEDHHLQPKCAGTYQPGQFWAEPDLDQAAQSLRNVYEHPDEARQRGQRAARDIRRHCSPAVIGQMLEDLLVRAEPNARARVAAVNISWTGAASPTLGPHTPATASDRLSAMLAFYGRALREWMETRELGERLPFVSWPVLGRVVRLRPVARLLRSLSRLRRVGHLTSKETVLNSAAYETAQLLAHRQNVMRSAIVGLGDASAPFLEARSPQSIDTRLDWVQADTAGLTEQLRRLHDQLQVTLRRLDGQTNMLELQQETLNQLTHQVRITTSRLRMLESQPSSTHAASSGRRLLVERAVSGDTLVALIGQLERDLPVLAQARFVGFSVQGAGGEDLVFLAAEHFGDRLDREGWQTYNDAWYHVDFTEDWNRPILLENAARKLAPNGVFVLITDSQHYASPDMPSPPELHPTLNLVIAAATGIEANVRVWTRASL